MKYLRNTSILALLLMILPVFALAAEQQKTVRIDHKAMIGTQTLKPGKYILKYDDNQNPTNVTFMRDGKEVATGEARLVHKTLKVGAMEHADYETNDASGHPELRRVYMGDEQLVFQNPQNTTNTANASPTH